MQKTSKSPKNLSLKRQIFLEKFSRLEDCNEDEQKQKIGEMNEIVDGMNKEEIKDIFSKETFNKIEKMIEEKKMSMVNAILLLKHIGYLKTSRRMFIYGIEESSLRYRLKNVIIEEEKKNKESEKNLLVDLCECFVSLSFFFPWELILICVPCLLKVSLKKDEDEEIQKEVEMALLALSNIVFNAVPKELYLNEIKEIILYHQEYQNLTRLACQSAWEFLIHRRLADNSLEEVIVNELHLAREAARELEDLTRCIDWKMKEEEMSKEEANEVLVITGWMKTIKSFFDSCKLWNEEFVELISSIVQEYRTVKDKFKEISYWCISSLRNAAGNGFVPVEDLLKSGAIDAVLEEMQRPTLNYEITYHGLIFFVHISMRLKREKIEKMEEAKRKELKRKIFEKMEEEGYEDVIAGFHDVVSFLYRRYNDGLSLNIYDYFINI